MKTSMVGLGSRPHWHKHVPNLAMLMGITAALAGCEFPKPSFARSLAVAEEKARAHALTKNDVTIVQQFLADKTVPIAEREHRFAQVTQAVIRSASPIWLEAFYKTDCDAAFGHYPTEAVWGFITLHQKAFFDSALTLSDFGNARNNPELGFRSRDEVAICLRSIEGYMAESNTPKKAAAQEWAAVLASLLHESKARSR